MSAEASFTDPETDLPTSKETNAYNVATTFSEAQLHQTRDENEERFYQNSTDGQNSNLSGQGNNTSELAERERSTDVGNQNNAKAGIPINKTDKAYLDEIKRRKFDKKAKKKLFVGGLFPEATAEFLREKFQGFGEILDACIVYEKGTHVSRGFGYVTFSDEKDAVAAIKGVDGMRINGKTLCVEYADDPKFNSRRPPPRSRNRSRSRSPPHPRFRHPSPPRMYRDRYYERDRFYDPDPYYDRDRYARDRYEPDRYYQRNTYDPYYPSRDYYRSPPGYPGYPEYKDKFGRDIPPPAPRSSSISEVDHARLRVDRDRLRMAERYEADLRSRSYPPRRSPSPEDYRSRPRNYSPEQSRTERRRYSDSNSSEDGEDNSNTKPRQVSAFPSAYLS